MEKKLSKLVKNLPSKKIFGSVEVVIKTITSDSRIVNPDCMYIAIKGSRFDGHTAINEVIKNGAVVIVGERKPNKSWLKKTYIQVKDSRESLGFFSAAWYNNPSGNLKAIGITGTDGKTTTSNLIWWILKNSRKKTGLVSTINAKIGNKELDTGFHVTNPEPLDLQKYLYQMIKAKCKYAVLEVTSQGIDQKRIAGINFNVAVMTNITHDHLDYHKSFKKYRKIKLRLFKNAKTIILNMDDPSFSFIAQQTKSSEIISYSLSKEADYKVEAIVETLDNMKFKILNKGKKIQINSLLIGNYNISNILAAVAVARHYKCSWKNIQKALKTFPRPEGRLQEVTNAKGIRIFIDFAHTPNSIELILKQLKKHIKGKLIVIFGCAGERDKEKRILMPATSVTLAEISIFTAEDPRNENINDILKVMEKSAKKNGGILIKSIKDITGRSKYKNVHFYMSITERGEAIYKAINDIAHEGDTILICGKGHEKSMAYNNIEYEWSDSNAIKTALNKKVSIIEHYT